MPSIRFKAILPKSSKLLDFRKLNPELKNAVDKTGDVIRSDFRRTVKTWTTKPTFRKVGPKDFKGSLGVEVFAENKIYFYVVRGTKAHFVAPRRALALRFQGGYKAKSRTGVIGSRSGGAFGPTRFSKGHRVSGIKARDFDKEIRKRRQSTFDKLVRVAIVKSVKQRRS